MTRWLLAAEADKIQDFIFRSSRLVQVVGGSGLLGRFCEEVPRLIIQRHTGRQPEEGDEDIIIADGGSFLLTFDAPETAQAVGRDLAEAYYRATDGSLTVAEPRPYVHGKFKEASQQANADLRTKKSDRRGQQIATAHIPYMAFCASCGISLAVEYGLRHPDDQPNYLCAACRDKAAERDMIYQAPDRERFLSSFLAALRDTELAEDLPQEQPRDLFPRDADEVGEHDPRRYVAYLVADGNGMGVFFSQCDEPATMQGLSKALTQVLWKSLAQATAKLASHLWKDREEDRIPVTPLIVGGDDLFALVAAPYALDFARQVCLIFEDEMQKELKHWGFGNEEKRPTMAAAVVICKKNYPYALAHRQGEALLAHTKQLTRAARLQKGINQSAVSFTIVKGGDVELSDGGGAGQRKYVVPTLSPYWVADDPLPDQAQDYALDLQQLMDARLELRSLPGKRRAELRDLFIAQLPAEGRGRKESEVLKELADEWKPGLKTLLGRVGRREKRRARLERALLCLGDGESVYPPWRQLDGRSEKPFAHGLPDLLEMWDFAQDLEYGPERYEIEEEEGE